MPSLRELESAFGAWILHGTRSAALAELVAPDGWPVDDRLDIYRTNVFASLTRALAATYPVISRLVGEHFFAYAAHDFIAARPPRESCLDSYGSEFAAFLAEFPPCRALAYLPDVARLEWLMQQAALAAELPALAPAALAGIDAEAPEYLLLTLQPSLAYLSSSFPIDRIWSVNRGSDAEQESIDLAWGGVALEVRQAGPDVVYRALEPAGFAFRAALAAGATLGAAAEAALAIDATFDLARALGALFEEGAVTAIGVASTTDEGRKT